MLAAAASTAESCVHGHLEYQWDIGGQIVQAFSTNANLVDSPLLTTEYRVLVRCSTDNDCNSSDQVLVVPGDQLEASAQPDDLMELDLPAGDDVRMTATEPVVGGPCDLWIMGVQISGGGGQALRQVTSDGSAVESATALRERTCTEGVMSRVGGTAQHEFTAAEALDHGDVVGYMANALCSGVAGSLGRVKAGAQGAHGSRGRLNPNATPSCP